MSGVIIAPSVISADFGVLGAELKRIEEAGADVLHVDIMDGHFVPNITFGPAIVAKIKSLTRLSLDVHLMISHPRRYLKAFAQAGADHLTFHVEADDDVATTIAEIKALGCQAGLSVKPKTPLTVASDHLGTIDRLLVMTVEPGFGGQKFMPEMLPKVREALSLRQAHGYAYDIEVDGGLDKQTIGPSVAAGAEVIVAGTAVFGQADAGTAIREMRSAALAAL